MFEAHGSTGHRPTLSVSALAIVALLVVGVAVAGRVANGATWISSEPRTATEASPKTIEATPANSPAPTTPGSARLPAAIACGAMISWKCRQLVLAGTVLLSDEEGPLRADVFPSLACSDEVDCPRSFLDDATPAGSVVLTLANGATAWVNVVMTGTPRRVGEAPPRFVGRLIRWFPPDA
jgi:hypothetical protein